MSRATIMIRAICNSRPNREAKPAIPPKNPCPNSKPNRPAPRKPAAMLPNNPRPPRKPGLGGAEPSGAPEGCVIERWIGAAAGAVGVLGGYLITVVVIGVDSGAFWSQMQGAVDFRQDILNGVIKSVVFDVTVTWIAVFEGYDAPPTAEGVSRATTRTVVTSSLAILALDFVLTALMFTGGNH